MCCGMGEKGVCTASEHPCVFHHTPAQNGRLQRPQYYEIKSQDDNKHYFEVVFEMALINMFLKFVHIMKKKFGKL